MTLVHWSMPPVLLRTNFMDRKARDSFFYGAAYQSNPLCSAARMKMSDAPGQRTLLQLREWQRPRNGHCVIARANTSAKGDCVMNSGRGFQRVFQRQSRTAQMRPAWQTH